MPDRSVSVNQREEGPYGGKREQPPYGSERLIALWPKQKLSLETLAEAREFLRRHGL